VGDEALCLLGGHAAPHRLRGADQTRVGRVDEGAGDQGRGALGESACGQGGVQLVGEGEADRGLGLRDVPVQRDGRHHVGRELVLHQQVADLRPVAVGDDHLGTAAHHLGHVPGGDGDRRALGGRRRRAVGTGHRVAPERDDDATREGHCATLPADPLAVK
jgi:hypothetical protein